MNKKERELLNAKTNYTLKTLMFNETVEILNSVMESKGGILEALTKGYTLGYERATRHAKNKLKG